MSDFRLLDSNSTFTAELFREGTAILVDKPTGWTSFDIVNKLRFALRRLTGVKRFKVGHAGTLDPMATGLLLLCTGKWTKRLSEFQGLDKEYLAELKLGATTPSRDAETAEEQLIETDHVTDQDIRAALQHFVGPQDQIPPMYSAIKVDGVPLYKRARKGQDVEVKPRKVIIQNIVLESIELPFVTITVSCGKGTYIRSLAHDIGQQIGVGAYLTKLRRTTIGNFNLEKAWQIEDLVGRIDKVTEGIQKKSVS